jgi:hypothetical protein
VVIQQRGDIESMASRKVSLLSWSNWEENTKNGNVFLCPRAIFDKFLMIFYENYTCWECVLVLWGRNFCALSQDYFVKTSKITIFDKNRIHNAT